MKTCSPNWNALQEQMNKESKNLKVCKAEKPVEKSKGIQRKRRNSYNDEMTWKKARVDGKKFSKEKVSSNKRRTSKNDKKHLKENAQNNGKSNDENPEVWFDDVDADDIMAAEMDNNMNINKVTRLTQGKTEDQLVKHGSFPGLTKTVAMDCEMVGVGDKGSESILARISIVNQFGKCVYDKHVKPQEEVTDYRTFVSGIRASDLVNADEFSVVQKEVAAILQGRILVGHALWNDLKVLFITHPKMMIRDTAKYKPFVQMNGGQMPGLKRLCLSILGVQIQKGEHSSVQDAQAVMRLYTMHKKQWEAKMPKIKQSKKVKKKMKSNAIIAAALQTNKCSE